MSNKVDINALKEVVEFGYELYSMGKDVLVKPIDFTKIPAHIIPLYEKAVPAIKDIGQILPELEDLDTDEAAQLVALIASKGVENAKTQEIVKQSLECAIAAYNLVKAIQA